MRIDGLMSPKERAERDNMLAALQRNADIIEYIAMMSDVDIPTEEGIDDAEQEI